MFAIRTGYAQTNLLLEPPNIKILDHIINALGNTYINFHNAENKELMKGRITKWLPIHLNLATNNHFLSIYHGHFKQPWIRFPKWNFDNIKDLQNENNSIIYLAYSVKTRLCYVGETQNLKYRIETELRNAKNSTTKPKAKTSCMMYSEKRMGHIGYETWNYAILANLGKLTQNQKQIRLRYEQYFIKKLQPKLNIKYNIAFRKDGKKEAVI